MNILIINGSPRKKGLISQMLGIMQEEAASKGDQVQTVYTNDLIPSVASDQGRARLARALQRQIKKEQI
jgi:multimeric flavodoxin WrbA